MEGFLKFLILVLTLRSFSDGTPLEEINENSSFLGAAVGEMVE